MRKRREIHMYFRSEGFHLIRNIHPLIVIKKVKVLVVDVSYVERRGGKKMDKGV